MSFVTVPIKQGTAITKFPNGAIPEFTKESIQRLIAESNLQFQKDLVDNLQMINRSGSATGTGDIISFTPPTGTTFYYLGASYSQIETTAIWLNEILVNIGTENAGDTKEDYEFSGTTTPFVFGSPMFSMIGNDTRTVALEADNASGSGTMRGNLWGFTANTISK